MYYKGLKNRLVKLFKPNQDDIKAKIRESIRRDNMAFMYRQFVTLTVTEYR